PDQGVGEEILRHGASQELLDALRQVSRPELDQRVDHFLDRRDDQTQEQVHERDAQRDVESRGPKHPAPPFLARDPLNSERTRSGGSGPTTASRSDSPAAALYTSSPAGTGPATVPAA